MARRQIGQLDTTAGEKAVAGNKKDVGSLALKACEGRVDLTDGAAVEDLDLQSDGASSRCHVSQRGFGTRNIGRIDEHCHTSPSGHQFMQKVQSLCRQLSGEKIDACGVAARSSEAADKTKFDRVFVDAEYDGDGRGCRLGR